MTVSFEYSETPDSRFDPIRFNRGTQVRKMLIFLLDTSGSMNEKRDRPKRPIEELNDAVEKWAAHLKGSAALRYQAEVAVITFGISGVRVHKDSANQEFVPAATFTCPTLAAGGTTPMFEAIRTAVDLSERRKSELKELGIQYFRPLIFMLTDGGPSDPSGHALPEAEWQPMADQIAVLEANKKLAFFAIGVSGANRELLKTLAPEGNWQIEHDDLARFLIEASNSAEEDDPVAAARKKLQGIAQNSVSADDDIADDPIAEFHRKIRESRGGDSAGDTR